MMWKIGMVSVFAVLIVALFAPMSTAANSGGDGDTDTNVWNRISIETGNTTLLGGGDYIAIKSNGTFIGVIYGSRDHPNSVKIMASTVRYAGGIKIYDRAGHLQGKKVLRYQSFVGQSFNYIWEFMDNNHNNSFDAQIMDVNGTLGERQDYVMKGVSLYGTWKFSGIKITNISSNETRIDFTVYRENVPYTKVYNSSYIGDGVVNRIAFHFHIMVKVVHKEVKGFPWYAYKPRKGVYLEERKNYSGNVVIFQIKYDKDIQGWDYAPGSRLAVGNNIFFGIAGNDKIVHMIIKRYGGCRAKVDNHTYDNSTLPHRRLFRHSGRITFTELGEWHRIGRFIWESNVTVDGQNKTAYFEINGGERIYRWFGHHAVAVVVLHGMLIYPAGNEVFQDPMLEIEQIDINFGERIIPTGFIAMMGLAVVVAVIAGAAVYLRKKH